MSFEEVKVTNISTHLLKGLAASLLLHLLLFEALTTSTRAVPDSKIFEVDFVTAPAAIPPVKPVAAKPEQPLERPERQIISPPEAGLNKPPKDTPFRSDVDSSTEIEQIRRGDGLEAGPVLGPDGKQSPAKSSKAAAESVKKAPLQKTETPSKQLDLSPDYQMLTRLSETGEQKKPQAPVTAAPEPEPFSRSPGSGARFIGFHGTTDYIPGIRDGDLTMLNAKADKYAVFVRRVATQVFQQLKQDGWKRLRPEDIHDVREYAVVRARLSKQGDLLTVDLLEQSQSGRFDNTLFEAVQAAARDPHPPPGALAADGTYSFIFMAKCWSRSYADPRRGLGEQRWLLLSTGLE